MITLSATFAGVMSTIGYILIALLALVFMVVIHELGHYTAGRLLGFKVLEFGIGFGPPIFKKTSKKTGMLFTVRPIPLGGFCQFEDEDADSASPTAFNNQKPWKRLIVLFAGAFSNFLAALIIITFFFTFYGQVLPSVYYVNPESANLEVLQKGDVILRVDGKQVNILMQEDYSNFMAKVGDTATFTILRDGKTVKVDVVKSDCPNGTFDENGVFVPAEPDENGNPSTYFGFGFNVALSPVKLNFFRSFGRAFSFMFFMVFKILAIFGQLITGKLGMSGVGGPISTIGVISEAASGGLATLSYAVCLISANLAVMNLLPLPALDGSRMVFCLIEWIFKKPVNKKVEGAIHAAGFIFLLAFALFADVFRLITGGG